MSGWMIQCLICGQRGYELIHMQNHAMNVHGFTLEDFQRGQTSQQNEDATYTYLMHGKPWLWARRRTEADL